MMMLCYKNTIVILITYHQIHKPVEEKENS